MAVTPAPAPGAPAPPPLRSLLLLALGLGVFGFGGGYAVLTQLRRVVVTRRRWLSEGEYLDTVAISQSLPGASGANFFTLLGLRFAGLKGAALSTALFLLPSAALMALFGAYYSALRGVPQVETLFAGMNPAVVAVVAGVAWDLGKPMRRPAQFAGAIAALAAVELGIGVLEVVLVALFVGLVPHLRQALQSLPRSRPLLSLSPSVLLLPKLALIFLRVGAATFGGGLAMIPVLDHEIVGGLHWLSPHEFSDAVTLGQITPGPVAITATFVGYRIAGLAGALISTVATFFPAFLASVIVGRSVQRYHRSPIAQSLFAALAPAIVGIVAAAAVSLARTSIHSWTDSAMALGGLALLLAFRAPPLLVLALAVCARALVPLFAG